MYIIGDLGTNIGEANQFNREDNASNCETNHEMNDYDTDIKTGGKTVTNRKTDGKKCHEQKQKKNCYIKLRKSQKLQFLNWQKKLAFLTVVSSMLFPGFEIRDCWKGKAQENRENGL